MITKSISEKKLSNVVEKNIADLSPLEIRHKIQEIEDEIRKLPGHVVGGDAYPLKHSFGKGLYVREMTAPPGFLTATKIHKFAHPLFLLKGTVSILEESGWRKVTAPAYFITKAGTKRIVFHHDEVVLVTVHATESTDLKERTK